MTPLKILITNNTLSARAGTELYVSEVATALLKRGHRPVAYSNVLGEVAEEMRATGIPVIDRLDVLAWAPDIIHGHHHLEVMTALLHFTATPAVYFCHSWKYWEETPFRFSRIRRYAAVNTATYNRLTCEHGIPEERVAWMLNFVDLVRFRPRSPLPVRPSRALVFSNYATEDNYLPVVREACRQAGLTLEVIGSGVQNPCAKPWMVLGQYDLVFASGRSALESLAVGAAVIACNYTGLGCMVTAAELDHLRNLNFGPMSAIGRAFTVEEVLKQIARYDAADAAAVTRRVRATAGLEAAVDRLVDLYETVISEHRAAGPISREEEGRDAAAYMRTLSARLKTLSHHENNARATMAARDHFAGEYRRMAGEHHDLAVANAMLQDRVKRMERSATWRCRDRLIRIPGLARFYRALRRTSRVVLSRRTDDRIASTSA
jgi:hypothetical protein